MKVLTAAAFFLIVFVSNAFALKKGDMAPSFALQDGGGRHFYLSDYIGQNKKHNVKGLIISFFASWCKPCRNELPILNGLVDEFDKKGIKVVVIGYQEDFDRIDEMLSQIKVHQPVILSDKYGKVGEKYGVRSLPMTFIVHADGRIKEIIIGEVPETEKVLREKVNRLTK